MTKRSELAHRKKSHYKISVMNIGYEESQLLIKYSFIVLMHQTLISQPPGHSLFAHLNDLELLPTANMFSNIKMSLLYCRRQP